MVALDVERIVQRDPDKVDTRCGASKLIRALNLENKDTDEPSAATTIFRQEHSPLDEVAVVKEKPILTAAIVAYCVCTTKRTMATADAAAARAKIQDPSSVREKKISSTLILVDIRVVLFRGLIPSLRLRNLEEKLLESASSSFRYRFGARNSTLLERNPGSANDQISLL